MFNELGRGLDFMIFQRECIKTRGFAILHVEDIEILAVMPKIQRGEYDWRCWVRGCCSIDDNTDHHDIEMNNIDVDLDANRGTNCLTRSFIFCNRFPDTLWNLPDRVTGG